MGEARLWKGGRRLRRLVGSAVLLVSFVPATPVARAAGLWAECPAGPVALTFDDGPVPGRTDRVLDVLAAYGAPATFFVNGAKIDQHPATLRRIAAEGHLVANHTWGHSFLTRQSDSGVRREIMRAVASAEAAGVDSMAPLVRPPFGATSRRVQAIIGELGMFEVMWNVDPQDWRGHSASTVGHHVIRRLFAGANVVLHDGSPASRIADALPMILEEMARRGFCPGLFDAAGEVVPAAYREPPPGDPGPECVGPEPCDTVGFVDAGSAWSVLEAPASSASLRTFAFGDAGDIPLVGDWDCDGVDTSGAYRPGTATVFLRDGPGGGPTSRSFTFGDPGDVLLSGDWNGDGCDTLGLYRAGEAQVYLSNRLGGRAAEVVFTFGNPGDVPFVGDFDGDGRDDVGLHRRSTGLVYMRLEARAGVADMEFTYGDPGDQIVTGDWDGDGVDTLAAYRPYSRTWYVKLDNRRGPADHVIRVPALGGAGTAIAGAFGP